MKQEPQFYICKHCGNIIGFVNNAGVPLVCCGEKMTELIPNTTDAATEKHVPVITQEDNIVTVHISTVDHPMLPEHHIAWIYLLTKQGGQRKELDVSGAPEAKFALTADDEIIAAYEYCNLHGLWKAEA